MSSTPSLHVIILAAGLGTRMRSKTPKVLHHLAGRPLLDWVVNAARSLSPETIHVIFGQEKTALQAAIPHPSLHWVHQASQEGTAHAVLQALPHIPDDASVLILSGDVPLIQTHTLAQLTAARALTLLVANAPDPTGYGRIVRNSAQAVCAIVEEADATPTQRAIQEIYTGTCVAPAAFLKRSLAALKPHNAQQEYYFTDIAAIAHQEHLSIETITASNMMEVQGVNTRAQLAMLERYHQSTLATSLLSQGVGMADPARVDIRGTLQAAQDVWLDINTVLEGNVILEEGCHIGPNCVLKDVTLGAHTTVLANSVLEGVVTAAHCTIGPFARLRPGTVLAEHCKVGNFVEVKNAQFAAHTKANHLTYLGDATIGAHVNVGAGTITCNYDGVKKHQTIIEDEVFIGSGTQLVAPICVGKAATIGAGTTVRNDVPAEALMLSDKPPKTIRNWAKRKNHTISG